MVDVDEQLHEIETRSVDARALLGLAGLDPNRALYRVSGDLLVDLKPGYPVLLSGDEKVFFRSVPSATQIALRLAA